MQFNLYRARQWTVGLKEDGLDAPTTVVDPGAGTGKFTRYLQQADMQIIAIEAVPSTRARLAVPAAAAEGTDPAQDSRAD